MYESGTRHLRGNFASRAKTAAHSRTTQSTDIKARVQVYQHWYVHQFTFIVCLSCTCLENPAERKTRIFTCLILRKTGRREGKEFSHANSRQRLFSRFDIRVRELREDAPTFFAARGSRFIGDPWVHLVKERLPSRTRNGSLAGSISPDFCLQLASGFISKRTRDNRYFENRAVYRYD